MTSNLHDQDTLLVFYKRLLLSIILLDLTVDYLIEPATAHGARAKTCSPEFCNVMAVRFVFSGTGVTWNPEVELRSMIKFLDWYIKVCVFTLVCSCILPICFTVGPHYLLCSAFPFQILPIIKFCEQHP